MFLTKGTEHLPRGVSQRLRILIEELSSADSQPGFCGTGQIGGKHQQMRLEFSHQRLLLLKGHLKQKTGN